MRLVKLWRSDDAHRPHVRGHVIAKEYVNNEEQQQTRDNNMTTTGCLLAVVGWLRCVYKSVCLRGGKGRNLVDSVEVT